MASVVTMRQLLEAGVHFGHRTRRWNPKMRPFIFTERSGIHIIDLHQTMVRINQYYDLVRDLAAKGGTILFVGTKRQAQATIAQEAQRAGMPYVNIRWLGGTLTNWKTIKQRIDYLNDLERRVASGEFRNLSKKEQLAIDREIAKLNRRIGGLKGMKDLPDMLYVVDTRREELAVKEANKTHIPVLAIVDTNCDPDPIDYIIPGNDDAIRSIKLITHVIADAIVEGRSIREVDLAETGQVSEDELAEMEKYLGPSTLAKLQAAEEAEAAAAVSQAAVATAEGAPAPADAPQASGEEPPTEDATREEATAEEAAPEEAVPEEAPEAAAQASDATGEAGE